MLITLIRMLEYKKKKKEITEAKEKEVFAPFFFYKKSTDYNSDRMTDSQ